MRKLGVAVLTALTAWTAGCAVSTPMRWNPLPDETLVEISITHATIDPARRAAFDSYTDRLRRVMNDQKGIVGHSVRREIWGDQVWTYTVWRSSADRRAFVRSGLHRVALDEVSDAIVDMEVRRLQLPYADAPRDWSVVLAMLAQPAL